MKPRILSVLLAAAVLAAPLPALAQAVGVGPRFTLTSVYDLDATSYTYCNMTGINNLVSSSARAGLRRAKTSGSSTTIVSETSATKAFEGLNVGDVIYFNDRYVGSDVYGLNAGRAITAKASDDSITVDTAIDLTSGASYNWRKLTCGTADSSGAFPVDDWVTITVQVNLAAVTATSTDYKIQCRLRGPGTAWADINGPINNASTFNNIVSIGIHFGECRVGAKVNTDTAGAEQLTILAAGGR